MNIYLAGAIDNSPDFERWTRIIYQHLRQAWDNASLEEPLCIYSPQHAFEVIGDLDQHESAYIGLINLKALEEADVVLVYYQPDVVSWGTPIELFLAAVGSPKVILWHEFVRTSTDMSLKGFPVYVQLHVEDNTIYNGAFSATVAVFKHLKEMLDD